MSDFKAGDLVYVARPKTCCGDTKNLGVTYTIQEMRIVGSWRCQKCGFRAWNVLVAVRDKKRRVAYFPEVLKKYIPPQEQEKLEEIRKELV